MKLSLSVFSIIAILVSTLFFTGCSSSTYYLNMAQNSAYPANRAVYFKKIKQIEGFDVQDKENEKILVAKGYGSFLTVVQ